MNRKLLRSSFFAVLAMLTASSVFAEWYKDYEAGVDMVKKSQFDAAIPRLQAAASQKPEEGSNIKFYGMKFADYFPHYYLGLCYFNTKDYAAALREFDQSESYGAIRKKGDLAAKITQLRSLAQAQVTVAVPQVVKNAQPPIPENVQQQILQQQQQQQQQQIQTPPVQIQQQQQANKQALQNQKAPTEPPSKAPAIAPPAVDIGQEAARMMVKKGAEKYFDGDYDGAVSLLTSAIEASPNSASSYFLLGCAYSAKYLLSGSQNQEYFKNATLAFQKIRKIDPRFRIRNGSYFSPAILEIYAKTS